MTLNFDRILVVDLETTCDEPRPSWTPEIIEVGCAILDLKSQVVAARSIMVVPTSTPVTTFCVKLTTILPEDVTKERGAVPFEVACSQTRAIAKGLPWASWGDFDRSQFLRQCTAEHVKYPFEKQHVNVKALYGLVRGGEAVGMKQALEELGLPLVGTHHRGVDDAANIAKILAELIGRARVPRG